MSQTNVHVSSRSTLQRPQSASSSGPSGANASSEARTGPEVTVPTRGRRGGASRETGTSRAAGALPLQITTSSPASTSARSRDRCVLASCVLTLFMTQMLALPWTKSRLSFALLHQHPTHHRLTTRGREPLALLASAAVSQLAAEAPRGLLHLDGSVSSSAHRSPTARSGATSSTSSGATISPRPRSTPGPLPNLRRSQAARSSRTE